jgi:hypothetical protein
MTKTFLIRDPAARPAAETKPLTALLPSDEPTSWLRRSEKREREIRATARQIFRYRRAPVGHTASRSLSLRSFLRIIHLCLLSFLKPGDAWLVFYWKGGRINYTPFPTRLLLLLAETRNPHFCVSKFLHFKCRTNWHIKLKSLSQSA